MLSLTNRIVVCTFSTKIIFKPFLISRQSASRRHVKYRKSRLQSFLDILCLAKDAETNRNRGQVCARRHQLDSWESFRFAVYVDSPLPTLLKDHNWEKTRGNQSHLNGLYSRPGIQEDTNKKSTKASCSFLKLVPFADCRKRIRLDTPTKTRGSYEEWSSKYAPL